MPPRRFPPPWSVEELDTCFVVKDARPLKILDGCLSPLWRLIEIKADCFDMNNFYVASMPTHKSGRWGHLDIPRRIPMTKTVLSTGIISRASEDFNAQAIVVNLNPKNDVTVTVEMFDWGVEFLWSNPTPIQVGPEATSTIGPTTQRGFGALITQSTAQPGLNLVLYEIRITLSAITNVVVNCNAIDNKNQPIAGKTIRHKDLVAIPAL
jgi:hypothetical protein